MLSQRRRFLRLAASSVVGGLVLRLDREARGQETNESRFILYVHGNPQEIDSSSAVLESFAAHRQHLTLVQHVDGRGGALHCPWPSDASPCRASVDQVIAERLPARRNGARFRRSLALGHPTAAAYDRANRGSILLDRRGRSIAPILSPVEAHAAVFGVGGQEQVLEQLQRSYLDSMLEELLAFQSALPSPQAATLERSLDTVRSIESRTAHFSRELRVGDPIVYNEPAFWQYMCDLGIAALELDVTRQVTMLHSLAEDRMHYVVHGRRCDPADPSARASMVAFHFDSVARMFDRLRDRADSPGSLADHTLITCLGAHDRSCGDVVYLGADISFESFHQAPHAASQPVPIERLHRATVAALTGDALETTLQPYSRV